MLKQRVLTALLILPLALAAILLSPLWLFELLLLGVVALLAIEFAALCVPSVTQRTIFVVVVLVLVAATFADWQGANVFARSIVWLSVAFWVLAPIWFFKRQLLLAWMKMFMGVIVLAGAGVALHQLKTIASDGSLVLLVLLLVWAADIGAYAAGRLAGQNKLAPSISPGKTWEGFVGGLLLALVVGVGAGAWMNGIAPQPAWLALLIAVAVISVIGDLVESLLKRQAGVKDSGQLLPGHGGVLDRLDSLLAAAPLFLLGGLESGIFGGVSAIGA